MEPLNLEGINILSTTSSWPVRYRKPEGQRAICQYPHPPAPFRFNSSTNGGGRLVIHDSESSYYNNNYYYHYYGKN